MFDFPGSPANNQTITNAGVVYTWDGTKWVATPGTGSGGGATITISDTPPTNPTTGALWFDSVGAQTYLWFNDGTSSQWVPVNAPPSSSTQYLPISGGTMSGPLLLGADPATAMQAATKEYVDAGDANDATLAAENVGRNFVHNPNFSLQQRGAGPWTASGNYTCDRWQIGVTGDTVSFQPVIPGIGTVGGDENIGWVMRNVFTGTTGTTAVNYIVQKIEKVARLSGKTVTVSLWANGNTTGLKLGCNLMQYFGTGGSPSSSVWAQATGVSWTLAASVFTRYTATFTLPSISGKTLGSNGDDFTQLTFFYSAGATSWAPISGNVGVQSGTVWISGCQLEVGNVATPLDYGGSPQQQLSACQRFYLASSFTMYGYNGAGNSFQQSMLFPTTMRANPTLAVTPTTQTNCGSTTMGALANATGANIVTTVTALGAFALVGTFTASADL